MYRRWGWGKVAFAKKSFSAKRSLRKGDSWKVTCDVDVVFIHASKPRGGSEKNLYTLRGKIEKKFCSMKDDYTCKNNWSLLPADYLFNFLTFICKDQICSHAFLICNKTVSNVKHHAVGVIPTTWEFVSLSPESF